MNFAITDIHGCAKTFRVLVEKLGLNPNDHLYLLGDFINKGPDSKGVLELIFELKAEGLQLHCVRGNHDQMLLDVIKGTSMGRWGLEDQYKKTLESFHVVKPHDIPSKYIELLNSMPYYIETDKYLFVHAGFDFSIKDPFSDFISMMNIKRIELVKEKAKGKIIIHGHLPQAIDGIRHTVAHKQEIINLDNGCVYYHNKEYGNLVALNADKLELIFQPNIDQPYEIELKM
ncbi:MAG TPA: metallophosphoesterase family protein [Cytophagaceae bacterium]|jgi:serine/threonine protein phosphatase 1|nr:metallophosphoesterase family protein [Cytophagaceae bacterium]